MNEADEKAIAAACVAIGQILTEMDLVLTEPRQVEIAIRKMGPDDPAPGLWAVLAFFPNGEEPPKEKLH